MMLVLLLVPFLLLGLCAVAATLVGGHADRFMEAHRDSHLHHLPPQHSTLSREDVSEPPIRASG